MEGSQDGQGEHADAQLDFAPFDAERFEEGLRNLSLPHLWDESGMAFWALDASPAEFVSGPQDAVADSADAIQHAPVDPAAQAQVCGFCCFLTCPTC